MRSEVIFSPVRTIASSSSAGRSVASTSTITFPNSRRSYECPRWYFLPGDFPGVDLPGEGLAGEMEAIEESGFSSCSDAETWARRTRNSGEDIATILAMSWSADLRTLPCIVPLRDRTRTGSRRAQLLVASSASKSSIALSATSSSPGSSNLFAEALRGPASPEAISATLSAASSTLITSWCLTSLPTPLACRAWSRAVFPSPSVLSGSAS
mmetsp:Transcript_34217/g.81067  ORF Transcript_34217/g.81067 Transcript_34217/m.81067 type:complete len:211 (+) Transcript_34217:383-1015(+)